MIFTKRFLINNFNLKDLTNEYLSWFLNKENDFIIFKKKNLSQLKIYALKNIVSNKIFFFSIRDKKNLLHIGNIKFEIDKKFKKRLIVGIFIGNIDYQGVGVFSEVFKKLSYDLKKCGFHDFCATIDNKNLNSSSIFSLLKILNGKKI